ncbi:Jag N-terminal domain-containing protein [bacterium]|nr:Jag N-terminal domain-containing protein [candidate division CSSED10-310 bacterium]
MQRSVNTKTSVEITAESVEDALAQAREQLGDIPSVPGREVSLMHDVLAAPRRGFLGLGKRRALVRVTRELIEAPELFSLRVLERSLVMMGLDVSCVARLRGSAIELELSGPDIAFLEANRGSCFRALGHMLKLALSRSGAGLSVRVFSHGEPPPPRPRRRFDGKPQAVGEARESGGQPRLNRPSRRPRARRRRRPGGGDRGGAT